jgi:hypothetical protein
MLESAELGHLDEQSKCGGFAHAGDAHEHLEAALQGGIGGQLRAQSDVERGELAVDLRKTRSGLTLEQRRAVGVAAVGSAARASASEA